MLVQIQMYFNRNVRLFTAITTTVTCIHVLLAAEGGGWGVRSNQCNPPRYGPAISQMTVLSIMMNAQLGSELHIKPFVSGTTPNRGGMFEPSIFQVYSSIQSC